MYQCNRFMLVFLHGGLIEFWLLYWAVYNVAARIVILLMMTVGFVWRLLEVIGCKIYSLQLEDMSLEMLNSTGATRSLRVEELPKDEVNMADDETLIPVAHFHKVDYLSTVRRYLAKK